eukprot:3361353-Prymnesium_polylepis.1
METVCPDDPVGAFAELMKSPSFRNTYLPKEWRDGLTPAAIRQQMLETPFVAGMVSVYHKLKGWKAKRQHLSLFAPHFPIKMTMQLCGISGWKVYAARLHAGSQGPERPVPPAMVAFRIKPEQAEWLCDFVNRPEFTQTVASNKGADSWVCELTMRPEKLWRTYERAVPTSLRIARTDVLDYLHQKCFRLQRAKSCLCGPCEEH